MTEVLEVSGIKSFTEKVLRSPQPVIVDFYATWCASCRRIHPLLEQLATTLEDNLRLVRVNVEVGDNTNLSAQYGVYSLPTVLLFIDGRVTEQVQNITTFAKLKTNIEQFLTVKA